MTSTRNTRRDAATHATASAVVRDLLNHREAGDPLTIIRRGALPHVHTDNERAAFYGDVAAILGWHAVGGLLNGSTKEIALAKVDLNDIHQRKKALAADLGPILQRQGMIDGVHGVID